MSDEPRQPEPVSLAPLTPEEALRALLQVNPDDPGDNEQDDDESVDE